MNKKQLVTTAAQQLGWQQKQAQLALEALIAVIAQALANGDHVSIRDLGRFEMQDYPARSLRRFDGKGHYLVKARQIPTFRASPAFRQRFAGPSPTQRHDAEESHET